MVLAMLFAMAFQSGTQIRPDCAGSTPEVAACIEVAVQKSEFRMNAYLKKAIEVSADDAKLVADLRRSQERFETYRDAECAAVLQSWSGGGTARSLYVQGCYHALNDERTHTIWSNWLQAMGDNEPDLMPEPKPTQVE